jgi:hypothetical protein
MVSGVANHPGETEIGDEKGGIHVAHVVVHPSWRK